MTKTASTPRTWPAPLLAGFIHAVLLVLAAPPFNVWPLTFIALVPLAWLIARPTSRPWRDALLVFVGVLPMWGLWEWWTSEVTGLGYVPFVFLQSSYAAIFVATARRLHRKFPSVPLSGLVPAVWVAVEIFRGELVFDGYAWGLLAHPLIAVSALAAPAALLGTYFVSFLAAAVTAAAVELRVKPNRSRSALVMMGFCLVAWIASAMALPSIDSAAPVIRPAIVQTNLSQSNKTYRTIDADIDNWKQFEQLTREVAGNEYSPRPKPDVIIWPETMMPGPTLEPAAIKTLREKNVKYQSDNGLNPVEVPSWLYSDLLLQTQNELAIPMLIGSEALVNLKIEGQGRHITSVRQDSFNSVYLVTSGQTQGVRYDKVLLTPFGETMPYIRLWPWLQQKMLSLGANGMQFNLSPGTHMTVFNVPAASIGKDVRVVTPICFEVSVASHCRALVFDHGQRRADLIANVTNDGWFGNSDIARLQILQSARWRCLELATPMARAANTGISALIDAHGRLIASGVEGKTERSQVDGFLTGPLTLGTRTTLYARIGDVFAWVLLGLTLFALLASFFRRKTAPPAEQGRV